MPKTIDLTGKKIGRWTVLRVDPVKRGHGTMWICRCECGREKGVNGKSLRSGTSQGCARHAKLETRDRLHLDSRSPEEMTRTSWAGMRARCTNPDHPSYSRYGGRGITVCERWLNDFGAFVQDMGFRPGSIYTIERKDGTRGYEPDNCEWATYQKQAENRKSTTWLTIGDETMTIVQWAERVSVNPRSIYGRLQRGWSPEDAVFIRFGFTTLGDGEPRGETSSTTCG